VQAIDALEIDATLSIPLASAVALTSIGHEREINEDRYGLWQGCGPSLVAVVADGMGSYAGGAIAAELTIKAFESLCGVCMPVDRAAAYETLLARFYAADEDIRSRPEATGMGATVVAAVISERGLLYLHAGDARCYLLRNGRLALRSVDHSMTQATADLGLQESPLGDSMKSIVTSCVGGPGPYGNLIVDPPWQEDEFPAFHDLQAGDQVILCTDGLWNAVPDNELAVAAFGCSGDAQAIAMELGRMALERGADDNVTVVAIDVSAILTSGCEGSCE